MKFKIDTRLVLVTGSKRLAFLAASTLVAAAWAQPATFQGLGGLINGQGGSSALGVSPDGSTVVGSADSNLGSEAFVWRASTGMIGLGLPANWFPEFEDASSFASGATACSGNGDVVTGYVVENENGNLKRFRWDANTGMVKLTEDGFNSGRDISFDGNTITGETYTGFLAAKAFRWTLGDGLLALEQSSVQTLGWGISHDATVFGGTYSGFPSQAFIFDDTNGLQLLGDLPGGPEWSGANALSGDGTTAAGFGSVAANFQDQYEAMRWDATNGMIGLGRLPGTRLSSAFGVSNDGSTVVGFCFAIGNSNAEKAFIWTETDGLQDLKVLLESQGANLTGWRLRIAYAVSDDGRTIVGNAFNPSGSTEGFIARLGSTCSACAADYDNSGGVDGADVEAFFQEWQNSASCSDVDSSGGIDGSDVQAFFVRWSAGGC